MKKKTITFTTFTGWGAVSMAKFYRDNFGCEIIENPREANGLFTFAITEPKFRDL